jgi:branched-subunit amino acid transport protein
VSGASTVDVLLAIASLVLATYVSRAGMLLVGDRLSFSRPVEAALRFAPACALAALVLPEVLGPSGTLDLSLGNARWPAALASAAFLLWRNNMMGGIAVGMGVYLLFSLRSSVFGL